MLVQGVILFLSLSTFKEGKEGGYLVKESKIFYPHYFEKVNYFYSNSVVVEVESCSQSQDIFESAYIF